MSWQNWFQGWPVVVEKIGTSASGWYGPPKGTHGAGSQGGKVVEEASLGEVRGELRDSLSGEKWRSIDRAEKALERTLGGLKSRMGVVSERRGQGRYKATVPKVAGGVYARSRATTPYRRAGERAPVSDHYWEFREFASEAAAGPWFEY